MLVHRFQWRELHHHSGIPNTKKHIQKNLSCDNTQPFDTTYAEMHHENKVVLLLGTNFQIVMGMQHFSTNIGGQCWRQTKFEDPIFEVDVSLQV